MTVPSISCPSCGFTMQPVWYREKELDAHGIPTGRTYIDYDLDDGDRIMVDDSFYDDVLDAFEEYDIEYEEL